MRKPMVTRSVITTKATALTISGESLAKVEYILAGKLDDTAKALRKLQKDYPNDEIVKVIALDTETALYGVTVEDFMKMAVKLDDNRKIADAQ